MNLIREDYVLGNKKIVVGDNLHDLVLENLGKIWIRYGNSYKDFQSFISSVSKSTNDFSKVIIESAGIKNPEMYKSGVLVFDAKKKILYLKYLDDLLILLEYNDKTSEKYVNKSGDKMTGTLEIDYDGVPLKIKSARLVKNLNVEYLQGKTPDDFAQKLKNETIDGDWTFNGDDVHNGHNTFNNTVDINSNLNVSGESNFYGDSKFHEETEFDKKATFRNKGVAIRVGTGDIVTDGSMGSSQFMSGMAGYGWRLDADTNTLTIDNLIVRGVLNVFELVVNKISATNGSLWITDSFKIDIVHNLVYLNLDDYSNFIIDDINLNELFSIDKYYVPVDNFKTTITPPSETHPYATRSNQNPEGNTLRTFDFFKWIFRIIDLDSFKKKLIDLDITISSLFSEQTLINLHTSGIIQLSHMFLKDPENINEFETIENSNYILYPEGINNITNQIFTIVNSSDATLVDSNKYLFNNSAISKINLYYKYFGSNNSNGMNVYVIEAKHDEYPVFKIGDIIKCLKFTGNNVKQYHALVIGLADKYSFIIQLQNYSIVQEGTSYSYDENGQLKVENNIDFTLYDRSIGLQESFSEYVDLSRNLLYKYANGDETITEHQIEWCLKLLLNSNDIETLKNELMQSDHKIDVVDLIISSSVNRVNNNDISNNEVLKKLFDYETESGPEKDDALVRIGSIMFGDRRNSMYLTSSEGNSPYTDVLVGVNRPDYTVVYLTPKYVKFEGSQNYGDTDHPDYRKGIYYLQEDGFGTLMLAGQQVCELLDLSNLTTEQQIAKDFYLKYKDFAILVERPNNGEELVDVKTVKLTLLPNDNTVYINGQPLTLTVNGTIYYVSTDITDKIINDVLIANNTSRSTLIKGNSTIKLFV